MTEPYETPTLKLLGNIERHELKSWPENFRAVLSGRKRFEVRRDDRDPRFQPGDIVMLHEFDPGIPPKGETPRGYTGRKAMYFVGYVERSPALPDGWCGFELVSSEDLNRVGLAIGQRP